MNRIPERVHKARPPRPIPEGIPADPFAEQAWAEVSHTLSKAIPKSAAEHFLAPLRAVGARNEVVVVAGPPMSVDWASRRYGHYLGRLMRERGFRGIAIFDEQPTEEVIL